MQPAEKAGSGERTFRREDSPAAFVRYRAQSEAFRFLATVLADHRGIGLLHGPEPAGKTRLIWHFISKLKTNAAVAIIDGARMRPPEFLAGVLEQLGDDGGPAATDALFKRTCTTILNQARSRQAPILIVDDFNLAYPSTLHVLCKLASLTIDRRYALRIILLADEFHRRIIDSPSMQPIAARLVGDFALQPLSESETLPYLHARLSAFGVGQPERVFVIDMSTLLHAASGGWPANLDRIAESIVARAGDVLVSLSSVGQPQSSAETAHRREPVAAVVEDHDTGPDADPQRRLSPKLIVTYDRSTVREFEMQGSRAIIGRSELSDIVVESGYVSRQHAMLIRDQDGVVIIDLKSSNGTFVNSERVASRVLRNNDIIAVGNHRIKLIYPATNTGVDASAYTADDTATMKTLDDAPQSDAL